MAHAGGRPRKFTNPDELKRKGEEYFERCNATKKPYTITGLALALGFNSRQQMNEYEARAEFNDCLKRLRSVVEEAYEERIASHNIVAGPIFALKNMGWRDNYPLELTGPGGGPVQVSVQFVSTRSGQKADKAAKGKR